MEEAIRLTNCSQAALGEPGTGRRCPRRRTGSSRRRGPRSASTTPSMWALTHKPAAETSGDIHVWTRRGVTKGLSVLFARSCGLCPRVLV